MPEKPKDECHGEPEGDEDTPWLAESWKELLKGRKEIGPVFRDGVKHSKSTIRAVADDFREVFGSGKSSDGDGKWKESVSKSLEGSRKAFDKWSPRAKEALNRFGEEGEAWTERTSKQMRRGVDWMSRKMKRLFGGPEDHEGPGG